LLAEHPELEDLYPLAPMQQGILFHHLLGRTAGEYLEYFRGGLGALDLAAFRRAWKEVAARHPALRTLFFWRHRERPFQGVLRELPLPFEVHDLRALDGGAQEARIAAHVTPEALSERFDPGRAPLYHLALFRLADDAWELVWSFHDLILDGWSGPLVLNQVAERYRRLTGEPAAGEPAAGEPASRSQAAEEVAPAPPFRRYLEWLARQDPAPAEEFWRRELAGYEPPPPLTEGRRTAVAEGDPYGRRELTLPAAASDRLRGWARRRRLTLNTLVQAAWGLVLGRWQSREDVVFGSVVSGRPAELAGAAEMVGVPVNTLPVRLRLDSGAPGGSWLEEHQRRQVAARRFEHSSLVEIHRWSGVPREAPLFESIVAFVNYPAVAPGLWRRQRWSPQRIGYPLFLLVRPDRRLYLELTYDRRRFGNAAAARMLGQLRTALEGLSTVPGETLTEVPLLAAGERHQLLVEWNDSARPLPPTTVVEEVGERAREVPERIAAATFGDRSAVVSYGELLRRSAGVAAELAARGLEPGAIVILLAPRGVDFLVAVLALWRAGAAYLPLDPEHPPERLRRILERSGSRWALAASETSPLLAAAVEALPAAGRPRVEELGALIREGGRRPRGPSRALPDGLAYTLFTSGSTGVPKGAMIGHRGMLNHLFAKIRDLELDDRDRVAQTASQCFDVSVWQLVAALLVGGRVEVFERSDAADPERLPAALTAARVTVFETVPSLLRVMLEVAERAAPGEVPWPTGLRWLIPTGEELSAELCRRWLARRPEVPLVNAYGPTECSDDVTHHTLRRPPAATAARTPIGRPVANTRLYLLDRRLRPVPLGGTGALWVGGAGVGWGYLGEAGRTARAFVPDPFVPPLAGGAPDRWGGGRLYFTGDRARHLPGGELEFLGRLDHQVKVRGLRIELGEIETALERRSGVAQAAVIVRPDAAGNDALAAFVMPAAGTTLEVAALRRELRNELPAALVPTFWFELEALPRLPSGKVDRGALARRAPAPAEEVAPVAGGAPRTATEELLAGIWGELLGRARVGLEESFFDLGGHSLLATQMLSRIRSLGAEVPLRRLFEAPTVRALAAEVDRRLAGGGSADERPPPLRPGQRDDPPPLSFAQRRMWLTSRTMDDPSALHVSAPLRISGRLDPAILASALTEVVRRHEVLRTGFPMVDGEPVQVVAPPAPVPLPVIDLRRLGAEPREREAERLSSHLARRPFDLGRGPLLRVGLLRLGPRHHLLVNTLHHVVTDGWSTPILVRELLALYRPFRRGEPSPLPALPIQYADYACWQRRWLTGERRRRQLDYWRRQLAGASPRLALPGERQPGGTASNRGAFHHFELEPETSAGLLRLARELRATPFMTVLAVLEALLHRLTSKTDFVVATDVANREPPEVEGLIGFFVNVVALRADLSGTPTFRQLLERVRQVALGAFAHQQLPFAELLPEVDLEPVPYVGAPFNIYFTLVSEAPEADADESLALPDGATATLIERGSRQAPRDLTLAVRERAGILHGSWLYKTELLTGAAVVRWTESFRKLAAAVVEDPDRPLDELVLRSEEEARRLRGEKEDRQRRSFRKLEKIRPRGTEL
jgi:amino acid adenylation domain-containing protein